jgi:hypothetical protein
MLISLRFVLRILVIRLRIWFSLVFAELTEIKSTQDEEEIRYTSSNFMRFETETNMCQNLQEPGSTSSPQSDLGTSSGMPARSRGDWYQVPLLLEDIPVEGWICNLNGFVPCVVTFWIPKLIMKF